MHALCSACSLRDDSVITSKPTWKLKQISSKSIHIISSYTVSKLGPFFWDTVYVGYDLPCTMRSMAVHSLKTGKNVVGWPRPLPLYGSFLSVDRELLNFKCAKFESSSFTQSTDGLGIMWPEFLLKPHVRLGLAILKPHVSNLRSLASSNPEMDRLHPLVIPNLFL